MKKGKARSRTNPRARHPKKTGSGHGVAVFDRDFFERVLPALVGTCPRTTETTPVVTVQLGDGTELDCCGVVGFEERYVVLAAYEGLGDDGIPRTADDVGIEAIPYELVLRCSVRAETRHARLGFGEYSPRADAKGHHGPKPTGS